MKKTLLIFIVFFFLLILPLASAQESVSMNLSSTDITLYTGKTQSINLTIENKQNKFDVFSISVSSLPISGVSVSYDYAVSIPANSKITTKLDFSSIIDAPETATLLYVWVISTSDSTIRDSQTILLRTIKTVPVYISDIKLSDFSLDPEETLTIETQITNKGNLPSDEYSLQTNIKKSGEMIKRFDNVVANIPGRSTESIKNDYKIEKYQSPGSYTVEAILKDNLNRVVSSKTSTFEVNAISKIPTEYTEKTTSFGFLSVAVTIKIKNEGNAPSSSFYVGESIPSFTKNIFDPEIEPSLINETDGRVVYSWLVPSLAPGQEMEIKYQFILWHIWIALIIISVIVYFVLMVEYAPSIVKKHRHFGPLTKEKEIPIFLDVRNRTLHEIRDIYVRDFVPPIAKLVEKFETLKPAIVRTSERGTEIVWKFDSLKPREERVITYRIKPNVDITGTLKLPNAIARYTDRKKEKKSTVSKGIIISPK
jgi:hypothetical protein